MQWWVRDQVKLDPFQTSERERVQTFGNLFLLIFLYTKYISKYISTRTLTLSQGKCHFPIASHVTKIYNNNDYLKSAINGDNEAKGFRPFGPRAAGACGAARGPCTKWTPISLRQSGTPPHYPSPMPPNSSQAPHSWNIPKSHNRSFKILRFTLGIDNFAQNFPVNFGPISKLVTS